MSVVPDQRGRWGRGGVRKDSRQKILGGPGQAPFNSFWGSWRTRQASPAAPQSSPRARHRSRLGTPGQIQPAGEQRWRVPDTGKSGGTAGLNEPHCPADARCIRFWSAPCTVALTSFAHRSWHPPAVTSEAPVRANFRDLCPPACQASRKPGPQRPSCHSPGPKCPVLGSGSLPGSFS